jgi:hypothetical protein
MGRDKTSPFAAAYPKTPERSDLCALTSDPLALTL